MESRLEEKLNLIGGVVERVHAKIVARADALLEREASFDGKIVESFAPHEAKLDEADRGLDGLQNALTRISNDPLQSSGGSSEPEQLPGSDAPTEPGPDAAPLA